MLKWILFFLIKASYPLEDLINKLTEELIKTRALIMEFRFNRLEPEEQVIEAKKRIIKIAAEIFEKNDCEPSVEHMRVGFLVPHIIRDKKDADNRRLYISDLDIGDEIRGCYLDFSTKSPYTVYDAFTFFSIKHAERDLRNFLEWSIPKWANGECYQGLDL
ncbi:hypothetical protein CL633_03475 [bacterium]|nr:hypothetical protein [bacterium]